MLAIVEASDNLSLQVHPDDAAAKELEGAPFGKNESWYFLRPPKSGKIFDGTTVSSIAEVERLIAERKMSQLADTLEIETGDYVFVEAGTLHAITADSLVFEIEENSEYTYRVFDFDRVDDHGMKRPLHIDRALRALKPKLKSSVRRYEGAIAERLYTTQLLDSLASYRNSSRTLECLTLLDDSIDEQLDGIRLSFGMTIVLEPEECVHLAVGKTMLSRVNVEAVR